MKRQLGLLFGLSSAVALAAMTTFSNVSGTMNGTSLVVSFTESGLQPNDTTRYILTGNVSALYACVNRGGNFPKAANKRTTVNAEAKGISNLTANQSGVVTGTVSFTAPTAGSFSCPNGQDMVISSVTYTNVRLHDPTYSSSTSVAGTFTKTVAPIR
jgi:hypothetical protein